MTLPRNLASYGSPKKNARVITNPQTDITQGDWNRLVGDVAALTACPVKLRVQFLTTSTAGPVAVTPSFFAAQWGLDAASAPVVTKTGTGTYTVATPAAWATPGVWVYSLDPDGVTSVSEQVIWVDSDAKIDGSIAATAAGSCRTSRSGFTITVYVYDASNTLSDLSGGKPIRVTGA